MVKQRIFNRIMTMVTHGLHLREALDVIEYKGTITDFKEICSSEQWKQVETQPISPIFQHGHAATESEVLEYCKQHKIYRREYFALRSKKKLPPNFPFDPCMTFRKDFFKSNGLWGNKKVPTRKAIKSFCFRNNITTVKEYHDAWIANKLPLNYPKRCPHNLLATFFDIRSASIASEKVVGDYCVKHGLYRHAYFKAYSLRKLPKGFPSNPILIYDKPDFFTSRGLYGIERVDVSKKMEKLIFAKIKEFGIESLTEYQRQWESKLRPLGLPRGTALYRFNASTQHFFPKKKNTVIPTKRQLKDTIASIGVKSMMSYTRRWVGELSKIPGLISPHLLMKLGNGSSKYFFPEANDKKDQITSMTLKQAKARKLYRRKYRKAKAKNR